MYKRIFFEDFREWFQDSWSHKSKFSDEGLKYLYNHLCGIEESWASPPPVELAWDYGRVDGMEFDPVGICCEYSGYRNFADLQGDYEVASICALKKLTTVIVIPRPPGEFEKLHPEATPDWADSDYSQYRSDTDRLIIQNHF